MSIQATMDICFNEIEKKAYGDIFDILISANWKNFQNNDFKMILLGDEDYSWTNYTSDFEEARALLMKKQKTNEVGGIELFYEATDIGIEVIFFVDNQISISFSINRRMKLRAHTDFEWYMKRILLPLEERLEIEKFEISEQV